VRLSMIAALTLDRLARRVKTPV